jgi:hypothetical protein
MRYLTHWIQNHLKEQKSNLSVDQLSQALELTSTTDTSHEEQKILLDKLSPINVSLVLKYTSRNLP